MFSPLDVLTLDVWRHVTSTKLGVSAFCGECFAVSQEIASRSSWGGFCQNSVLKLKFVPNFAMHIGAFVLGTRMLDVIPTAKNRVEH